MSELITAIDFWVLQRTQSVLSFLGDWLSWKQRSIERTIIMLFAISDLTSSVLAHSSTWYFILTPFMVLWLVIEHSISNKQRVRNLLVGKRSFYRVFLLILQPFCIASSLLPPVRAQDLFDACQEFCWLAAFYVMALPSGGAPGEKRKAAITKIIDTFGREYVPEPTGAQA